MDVVPKRNGRLDVKLDNGAAVHGFALNRLRPILRSICCAFPNGALRAAGRAAAHDLHAAIGVRPTHWAFELRREVHKLIQLRREVRERGWFRIHMRREVHELSQRGPRRMSVGV